MPGGRITRCPNEQCKRLLIRGQTCTCGVRSDTGGCRQNIDELCQNGSHSGHVISADGSWYLGIRDHKRVAEKCRRRW